MSPVDAIRAVLEDGRPLAAAPLLQRAHEVSGLDHGDLVRALRELSHKGELEHETIDYHGLLAVGWRLP